MKALVVTLLASLVFAASAFATPRLEVGEGAAVGSPASVFLGYGQAKTDPAPSRIVITVPSAYAFTPHADGATPGTWIGTDVVQLNPQFGPNLATGLLTMEDPTAFGAEALVCTGRAGHDAVWAAHIGSASGVIAIPIFVDGRTFTICPDAAKLGGTPTAISLQLGLVGNSVRRSIITGPPTPGTFTWSATVSRTGLSDVEIRSIVDLPVRARYTAKVVHGSVRIMGRVTANGRGVGGVRIQADIVKRPRIGFVPALYTNTRADGRFTIVGHVRRGTFYVRVRAYADPRDVTASGCADGSAVPGGCVSATRNGFGLAATPASVRIHS
jgi:hypothetical protein